MTGNTGWWRRKASAFNMISVRGQTLELPHVFEDLLIEIKPKHNAHAGGEARPVNFALTYDLIKQLVVALDVVKVRVDPWQLIQLVQTLQAETGVDADILKFGNTDQMLRARLYKTYMEQHMMSLRANATRDREVRRIIQKRSGMGIDHQEGDGESKDVYDSESMLIYTAASHCCGAIDIAFGATSA